MYTKKDSVFDNLKKSKRKSRLATKRRKTHTAVALRERGRCGICKWNAGSGVHHVYGRGSEPNSWREQPDACIFTCTPCHPHGFLHAKGDNPELEKILEECVEGTRFEDWYIPYEEDCAL